MFQVETYCGGMVYKIKQFASVEAAKAYQAELHSFGHYFVPVIDLETADRKHWGNRIDLPIDEQLKICNRH